MTRQFGKSFTLTLMMIVLTWTGIAGAQAPTPVPVRKLIPFQGRLEDASGNPLSGSQPMVFRLYSSAAGTGSLWEEEHTAVSVNGGRINVLLGSITSLDGVDFAGQTLYLGITAGGLSELNQEMVPRHEIVPSFYALGAKRADSAGRADAVADGAVGASALAANAVSGNSIQAGSITEGKLSPELQTKLGAFSGTPFRVEAVVLALGGNVPVSNVSAPVQVVNSSMALLPNAGVTSSGANLEIPCSAGPSSGLDCGGNPEALGIVFDPPRAGMYEVCVDGNLFFQSRARDSASTGLQLKLVRTENGSPALHSAAGSDPDFLWQRAWSMAYVAADNIDWIFQHSVPFSRCELFSLPAGQGTKATFRLLAGNTAAPSPTAGVNFERPQQATKGLVRFRVKEIR